MSAVIQLEPPGPAAEPIQLSPLLVLAVLNPDQPQFGTPPNTIAVATEPFVAASGPGEN